MLKKKTKKKQNKNTGNQKTNQSSYRLLQNQRFKSVLRYSLSQFFSQGELAVSF